MAATWFVETVLLPVAGESVERMMDTAALLGCTIRAHAEGRYSLTGTRAELTAFLKGRTPRGRMPDLEPFDA